MPLIAAHAGGRWRDSIPALERCPDNAVVDISGCYPEKGMLEAVVGALGPDRCLFGSDMPILRMRMKRICEDGMYINVVPKGLYGDVSDDKNMREIEGPEAEELTFFMYEELLALKRAAECTELTRDDLENVFYRNSRRVLSKAGFTDLD